VLDERAFTAVRLLAIREGILASMSSGAAVAGALRIAQSSVAGTFVVILPDRGDRYSSTNLLKPFCAECPP